MSIKWNETALDDRDAIMDYISTDNWSAAIELDDEFEAKVEHAANNPRTYKPGRMPDTREIVVRPNYIMIYRIEGNDIEILRVLHARQQ
jgi:addiction module RelE/StbE family toxin